MQKSVSQLACFGEGADDERKKRNRRKVLEYKGNAGNEQGFLMNTSTVRLSADIQHPDNITKKARYKILGCHEQSAHGQEKANMINPSMMATTGKEGRYCPVL